jgi:hypothetical protein
MGLSDALLFTAKMTIRAGFLVAGAVALFALTMAVSVARTAEGTPGSAASQHGDARIFVGPNVHVSRESDGPYAETTVAAHPTDPNVLMAGANILGAWQDERHKVWISRDRGQSWSARYIPFGAPDEPRVKIDPVVAFGPSGTMLVKFTDQPIHRSDDGGRSWTTAVRRNDPSHRWDGDRETIGVDWSNGKYRGRIYHITNDAGTGTYAKTLLRSFDDGRTFEAAVNGTVGSWGLYPLVFSDGVLAVPVLLGRMSTAEEQKEDRRLQISRRGINLSADGGRTFTLVGTIPTPSPGLPCRTAFPRFVKANGGQPYAVDNGRASRFRDRLYALSEDCRDSAWRITLSYSTDRGKSWSEPKALSPDVPERSAQFIPAIAVNRDGTVMVIWYDTRDSEGPDSYHLYATTSVDGGANFVPAVRVSTNASKADTDGNTRQHAEIGRSVRVALAGTQAEVWVTRRSINQSRYVGDYVGLVADAGGVFHPVWVQTRDGTSHVYAAQLRVIRGGEAISRCGSAAARTEPRALNSAIHPETDHAIHDATFASTTVPLRLRNVSKDTLCGPFAVSLMAQRDTTRPTAMRLIYGETGALRDLDYLAPGATTEPIGVHIDLSDVKGDGSVRAASWKFLVTGP